MGGDGHMRDFGEVGLGWDSGSGKPVLQSCREGWMDGRTNAQRREWPAKSNFTLERESGDSGERGNRKEQEGVLTSQSTWEKQRGFVFSLSFFLSAGEFRFRRVWMAALDFI